MTRRANIVGAGPNGLIAAAVLVRALVDMVLASPAAESPAPVGTASAGALAGGQSWVARQPSGPGYRRQYSGGHRGTQAAGIRGFGFAVQR
ncbi:hypothetical protein ACTXJR_07995 [Glutamicibacter ardleyensis]|uniref:hypothetical protein n=1 Tax=Glutamicibacter ardleyensis TaxID=225894 RepID=UPI003F962BE1